MKIKIKCKCCGNTMDIDESALYEMIDAVERKHKKEQKKQTHISSVDDLMQLFGMKD
jgi:hypothetical protein